MARKKPNLITPLALFGVAVLLGVAGWLSQGLAEQRDELQLGLTEQTDTPPPAFVTLSSTVGGPARAVAVLYLWHRATELKDAGRHAEANQWSRWITQLQPGFPEVWRFHAWNMAYNISVTTSTPRERWFWVDSGIRLLRERGLRLNPRSYALYRELGYIFIHKINGLSDDMHWYYKRRLALEWQELLGLPYPGQDPIDRMRLVADSPRTIDELRSNDPAAAALMTELRRTGYNIDVGLLRTIGRIDMVPLSAAHQIFDPTRRDSDLFDPQTLPPPPDHPLSVLIRSIRDERGSVREQTLERILNTLRRQELLDRYNMDPLLMYQMMAGVEGDDDLFSYGPLDWRHPASHSLYWSTLAVRAIDRSRAGASADVLNTRRQILHGLQEKVFSGTIYFDPLVQDPRLRPSMTDPTSPVDRTISASPIRFSGNIQFAEAYEAAFHRASEVVSQDDPGRSARAYGPGHENLMLEVITRAWLAGDVEMAQQWLDRARELYGDAPHNIATGRYAQDLVSLVTEQFQENHELARNTEAFISIMLIQAIKVGLGEGNLQSYENFRRLARAAYDRFMEERRDDLAAPQGRMQILPFNQIEQQIFSGIMVGLGAGHGATPLVDRVRIWRHAPEPLKRAVWDQLEDELRRQSEMIGADFATAFPPPTPAPVS